MCLVFNKKKYFLLLIISLTLFSCSIEDPNIATEASYQQFLLDEAGLVETYNSTPISVSGHVKFETDQSPLSGVEVIIQGQSALTDAEGFFQFNEVNRLNDKIIFLKDGYYKEYRPIHLQVALEDEEVNFGEIFLRSQEEEHIRVFFGGDTTFARRMLDSTDQTPFDQIPINDPLAHIQVNDPLPGSIKAFEYVSDLFISPDYRVLNLESPVITDPTTVHPAKDYSFFTLPQSLDALNILNIDYVSLGNNHVYDYLESGVVQTMNYIQDYGIANSGLGRNTQEAFVPHIEEVKEQTFSMISLNTISGDKHDINYVAADNKGGAADGRLHDELQRVIDESLDIGALPIVQYHTGDEYTFEPSPFAHANMKRAIDMGASFVIAHHPHVAQGFEWYNGKFIAHSLGNFLLDQVRLETMMGVAVELDLDGADVVGATGIPVYLEDFKPRLIGGRLNANLINRLAEKSINAKVFMQGGRAKTLKPDEDLIEEERTITTEITITENEYFIDLRQNLKVGEYLKGVEVTGLEVDVGRDILEHGDFEDYDLDETRFELSRWDVTSEDRFSCRSAAYKGARGACLIRKYSNKSPTVLAFRNSVRVIGDALDKPNKDLSFVTYVKGRNTGSIDIYAKYTSSKDANPYGQESLFLSSSLDTEDWQRVFINLSMPADESPEPKNPSVNARALRVFVKHNPPKKGMGVMMVDEAAVISWEKENTEDPKIISILEGPNQLQYLRLKGSPGVYEVEIKIGAAVGLTDL